MKGERKNKGQVESQIFIYIMVLVVGMGILIYGYNAIKGFNNQANDVLYLQFQNTLTNDIKSISFESTRVESYDVPNTVTQVCFRAKDAVYADVTLEEQRQATLNKKFTYPLIAEAIGANGKGTENNVFVYPKGEKAFFGGINLEFGESDQNNQPKQFKCFDVSSGKLNIKITGKGSYVLIK